ncbi:Precorrin-3B C(17)-methyltransferase [Rhodovastum atsumiense]|uniref:precorrin-3B C(17)-methyltransferase n=1 Tax=Rhodovastum atsumiense TaxID=504468 RepID=UPI00206D3723|nr:Precorrin-3B C(17)-methyltransferase [Rhodovastum atsumiense]
MLAIVRRGAAGEAVAQRLLAACPDAELLAPASPDAFGALLRRLSTAGTTLVALGPLEDVAQAVQPGPDTAPVVVVAENGRAVVPLCGARAGGDELARQIGAALGITAAITSGTPPAPVPGRLAVVGLGPGKAGLMAPEVRAELDRAQDILGYIPYVRMAGPFRPDQTVHVSDNREELDRARHAFALAAAGRHVVVVSSGDPGIFAMAAALFEALERGDDPAWGQVDLVVLPGISAAQAAAARAGAPLGHDFCVISLSDNLKSWATIERRLAAAAGADLVLALYNPISRARPWQLDRAFEVLRQIRDAATPVVLGRDIGRPGESLTTTRLGEVRSDMVDMRTVVIVGSSTTRVLPRRDGKTWVYTPRWHEA